MIGVNAISFGVDHSSSVDIGNRKNDILFLGEGPTQGLDNTTITAEAEYSINFTRRKGKFCFKSALIWEQQFFIY